MNRLTVLHWYVKFFVFFLVLGFPGKSKRRDATDWQFILMFDSDFYRLHINLFGVRGLRKMFCGNFGDLLPVDCRRSRPNPEQLRQIHSQ